MASVRALGLLVVIEVGIRLVPLPVLCRRLGVSLALHGPAGEPGAAPLSDAQRRRLRACDRALRIWPAPATCLRRSLLLATMLPELHPVLRLGWRTEPAPPVAHAWLEVDGRSLDRDMRGIAPLERELA